jgi:hypothetical protein
LEKAIIVLKRNLVAVHRYNMQGHGHVRGENIGTFLLCLPFQYVSGSFGVAYEKL